MHFARVRSRNKWNVNVSDEKKITLTQATHAIYNTKSITTAIIILVDLSLPLNNNDNNSLQWCQNSFLNIAGVVFFPSSFACLGHLLFLAHTKRIKWMMDEWIRRKGVCGYNAYMHYNQILYGSTINVVQSRRYGYEFNFMNCESQCSLNKLLK